MRKLPVVPVICLALTLVPIPAAVAGPPATFSYSEQARAIAHQAGTLNIDAGKSIVVQTHVLEPGFRAPWHRHPDFSLVLIKRGVLTVHYSCRETERWEAGNAYLNRPSEMAINEGNEPVELVVVYLNVPALHPAGVLPATPILPPADCPL
jgi:quercetin dioxygenase-like cupin family protein